MMKKNLFSKALAVLMSAGLTAGMIPFSVSAETVLDEPAPVAPLQTETAVTTTAPAQTTYAYTTTRCAVTHTVKGYDYTDGGIVDMSDAPDECWFRILFENDRPYPADVHLNFDIGDGRLVSYPLLVEESGLIHEMHFEHYLSEAVIKDADGEYAIPEEEKAEILEAVRNCDYAALEIKPLDFSGTTTTTAPYTQTNTETTTPLGAVAHTVKGYDFTDGGIVDMTDAEFGYYFTILFDESQVYPAKVSLNFDIGDGRLVSYPIEVSDITGQSNAVNLFYDIENDVAVIKDADGEYAILEEEKDVIIEAVRNCDYAALEIKSPDSSEITTTTAPYTQTNTETTTTTTVTGNTLGYIVMAADFTDGGIVDVTKQEFIYDFKIEFDKSQIYPAKVRLNFDIGDGRLVCYPIEVSDITGQSNPINRLYDIDNAVIKDADGEYAILEEKDAILEAVRNCDYAALEIKSPDSSEITTTTAPYTQTNTETTTTTTTTVPSAGTGSTTASQTTTTCNFGCYAGYEQTMPLYKAVLPESATEISAESVNGIVDVLEIEDLDECFNIHMIGREAGYDALRILDANGELIKTYTIEVFAPRTTASYPDYQGEFGTTTTVSTGTVPGGTGTTTAPHSTTTPDMTKPTTTALTDPHFRVICTECGLEMFEDEEGMIKYSGGGDAYCYDCYEKLFTGSSEVQPEEAYDTDGNGTVDIADATAILRAYAESAVNREGYEITAEEFDKYDINHDGKIDIADATAILSYYAKKAAGLLS